MEWKKQKGSNCFLREEQLRLIRLTVFAHDPQQQNDSMKLLSLVKLISTRLKSTNPAETIVSYLTEEIEVNAFAIQQFCHALLKQSLYSGPAQAKTCIDCFMKITNCLWAIPVNTRAKDAVKEILLNVYDHVVDVWQVMLLGFAPGESASAVQTALLRLLWACLRRGISFQTAPESIFFSFVRALSVPLLSARMQGIPEIYNSFLEVTQDPPLFERILRCICELKPSEKLLRSNTPFDENEAAADVADSSDYSEEYVFEDDSDEELSVDQKIMVLMPEHTWLLGNFLQLSKSANLEDSTYFLPGLCHLLNIQPDFAFPSSRFSQHPVFMEQMNSMKNEKFLDNLASLIWKQSNAEIIADVALFLEHLSIKWPRIELQILKQVVLSANVLPTLYKVCTSFGKDAKVDYIKGDARKVMSFFCRGYTYALKVLDDHEVHVLNNPIPKSELGDFVSLIRDMLYTLYWKNPPEDLIELAFRRTLTDLFQMLRDRQARRQICDPECFTIPLIDSSVQISVANPDSSNYTKSRLIVNNIPCVLSFDTRVRIFQHRIQQDKERIMQVNGDIFARGLRGSIDIRRGRVLLDGFNEMFQMSDAMMKGSVQIRFIGLDGGAERGVDGGGLFKEFMHEILQEACDSTHRGLFIQTSNYLLYPNPQSSLLGLLRGDPEKFDLKLFRFIGRLVGKAMYDGILIEPRFANFFLRKMLGLNNYVDDLQSLDPDLYKNLISLKHEIKDIDSLSLTFSVMTDNLGHQEVTDLVKGGRHVAVTKDNVLSYITRMAHFRLNKQIRRQAHEFREGFWSIIQKDWLCLFSPEELLRLICGSENIDMQDLQNNVVYHGDYHIQHRTVRWFWEVVFEMTPLEKKQLLMFTTSCSRAPLLGFSQLNPRFGISLPHYDTNQLPTASTCANLLKLPPYESKFLLREKLRYAISSNSGFELS